MLEGTSWPLPVNLSSQCNRRDDICLLLLYIFHSYYLYLAKKNKYLFNATRCYGCINLEALWWDSVAAALCIELSIWCYSHLDPCSCLNSSKCFMQMSADFMIVEFANCKTVRKLDIASGSRVLKVLCDYEESKQIIFFNLLWLLWPVNANAFPLSFMFEWLTMFLCHGIFHAGLQKDMAK